MCENVGARERKSVGTRERKSELNGTENGEENNGRQKDQ